MERRRETIFFERLQVGNRDDNGIFIYDPEWKRRGDIGYRQGRYSIGWNADKRELVFLRWRPPEEGSAPHPEWRDSPGVSPVSKQMEKILRAIIWPEAPEDFIREDEP